jgi:hypothetical protein
VLARIGLPRLRDGDGHARWPREGREVERAISGSGDEEERALRDSLQQRAQGPRNGRNEHGHVVATANDRYGVHGDPRRMSKRQEKLVGRKSRVQGSRQSAVGSGRQSAVIGSQPVVRDLKTD